ncbi:MAG TPA: glycosyltransferase family 1 protein [Vicinamibacterales bacterium]|nr:glycosyltransferase family 1 protein [Vicinamibacterales bacterium]
MRIGVDATCWANDRGYGRFTRELVRAMAAVGRGHEFVCLLDDRAAARFELVADNVTPVVVAQGASPTTAAAADGYRSPIDMLRLSRALARESLDVFFSPTVYTYFPLPPRLPAVVTLHDAIAERFPRLTLPTARARLFWRMKVRLALWQARLVLTVSEFAAKEIAEVHGIPPTRIRVALEAPSPEYRPSQSPEQIGEVARRIGLPPNAQWLTYVGGFSPHKNLDVLVRAHRLASAKLERPLFLVLIGALTGDAFLSNLSAIRDTIRACGTGHLVIWPGFLPDEDIRHLHSGALALVLPSENEGFGLPAVEAAACGAPVIATTASPLPGLLDGAGLFVAPRDEAGLAAAIERIATDPQMRDRLSTMARTRASELSWPRGARSALAAIEEAAA